MSALLLRRCEAGVQEKVDAPSVRCRRPGALYTSVVKTYVLCDYHAKLLGWIVVPIACNVIPYEDDFDPLQYDGRDDA